GRSRHGHPGTPDGGGAGNGHGGGASRHTGGGQDGHERELLRRVVRRVHTCPHDGRVDGLSEWRGADAERRRHRRRRGDLSRPDMALLHERGRGRTLKTVQPDDPGIGTLRHMSGQREGFLMLADVSGYTRFLSGVELDHSRDLIANLLGIVVSETRGVMELAKLEGDAVFCFEAGRATPEGMVTLAEAVYFAFRRWRRDVEHLTTCRCDACRRIPDLDLKVIVHRGEFAIHEVAGSRELLGPQVILAH